MPTYFDETAPYIHRPITIDGELRDLAWMDEAVRTHGGAPIVLPDNGDRRFDGDHHADGHPRPRYARCVDTDHLVWDTVRLAEQQLITTTTGIAEHITWAIDNDDDATIRWDAHTAWLAELHWLLGGYSSSRLADDSEWMLWADHWEPAAPAVGDDWSIFDQACADGGTAAIEGWLAIAEQSRD